MQKVVIGSKHTCLAWCAQHPHCQFDQEHRTTHQRQADEEKNAGTKLCKRNGKVSQGMEGKYRTNDKIDCTEAHCQRGHS